MMLECTEGSGHYKVVPQSSMLLVSIDHYCPIHYVQSVLWNLLAGIRARVSFINYLEPSGIWFLQERQEETLMFSFYILVYNFHGD